MGEFARVLQGARVLHRYRYTIFYRRISASDIEIIRVVHSARVRDLDEVPNDGGMPDDS